MPGRITINDKLYHLSYCVIFIVCVYLTNTGTDRIMHHGRQHMANRLETHGAEDLICSVVLLLDTK
jgi:hypothetical protein